MPNKASSFDHLRVIDSHTAGEPTRVVVEGVPDLGHGDMRSRLELLRGRHDWVRTSLLLEPRGSESMVGAVLLTPQNAEATAGVIYFNNVGYLGMCGHGTIGLVQTLSYLNSITAGRHCIETPVGNVKIELDASGEVAFDNVLSYRWRKGVAVEVPGHGRVLGDVAYGGNWFYIVHTTRTLRLEDHAELTSMTSAIKQALSGLDITGRDGAEIDHVELVGPPSDPLLSDAKNFVLCPGDQYDRSPCGTGVSAKLACLAADAALEEGDVWTQESIVGGVFSGRYRRVQGGVIPTVVGRAYVNGDTRVQFDPDDPFRYGFPSSVKTSHARSA